MPDASKTLTGSFKGWVDPDGSINLSVEVMTPTGPIQIQGKGSFRECFAAVCRMLQARGVGFDKEAAIRGAAKLAGAQAKDDVEFALGFFPAATLVHPSAAKHGAMLFRSLHAPDAGTRDLARSRIQLVKTAARRGSEMAGDVDYVVRRLADREIAQDPARTAILGSFLDDLIDAGKTAGKEALAKILPGPKKPVGGGGGSGGGGITREEGIPPMLAAPPPPEKSALDSLLDAAGPGITASASLLLKANAGDKTSVQKVQSVKQLADAGVPKAQDALVNLKVAQKVVNVTEASSQKAISPEKVPDVPASASTLTATKKPSPKAPKKKPPQQHEETFAELVHASESWVGRVLSHVFTVNPMYS